MEYGKTEQDEKKQDNEEQGRRIRQRQKYCALNDKTPQDTRGLTGLAFHRKAMRRQKFSHFPETSLAFTNKTFPVASQNLEW